MRNACLNVAFFSITAAGLLFAAVSAAVFRSGYRAGYAAGTADAAQTFADILSATRARQYFADVPEFQEFSSRPEFRGLF